MNERMGKKEKYKKKKSTRKIKEEVKRGIKGMKKRK